MTKVCYNALPMSAFTTLQKKVFPIYFRIQSLLLLGTALTHPPYGPVSLATSVWDVVPLAFSGALATLNLLKWGPKTTEAMIERIHQGMATSSATRKLLTYEVTETKDGKKYNDPDGSEEMKAKNRAFSRAHAMSIHLNLMVVMAHLFYGFRLASRLELAVK